VDIRCRRSRHRVHATAWRAPPPPQRLKLAGTAFPGPAAINRRTYDEAVLPISRFLQSRGLHVSAKNSTAVSTSPKTMADQGLHSRDASGCYTSVTYDDRGGASRRSMSEAARSIFSLRKWYCSRAYTYENVRLLLLSKAKRFRAVVDNAGRSAGFISATIRVIRDALVPFDLNNWYGGQPRASPSTIGRTIILITLPRFTAAAICGSIRIAAR